MVSVVAVAVQPGTVAGWITVAALVYGLVLFRRGGGGAALQVLETANRILEHDAMVLKAQAKTDAATIATLQASRDFTSALAPFVAQVIEHEKRTETQFAAVAAVLEQITNHLDAMGASGNATA